MPTVISSKSPGFIKRRPRCLNLYAAKASQAQRKREAISDDCIPALVCVDVLPNECPASSPSLLVTDLYSVSATVQIIFKQRFFKERPLLDFVHECTTNIPHLCYSSRPWSSPWQPLQIYPGSGSISGHEEPCLVSWSAISIPSIPMSPDIHISWMLFCSASVIRDGWQFQSSLESRR